LVSFGVAIVIIVIRVLVNDIERRTTVGVGVVKVSQNASGSLIVGLVVHVVADHCGVLVVVPVIGLLLHDQ
jgi:hypothetical protein